MLTSQFVKATLERAIKTFAQTLAALLGVTAVTGILDAPWVDSLSVSALAAFLSVLTSVASSQVGDSSGPSLTSEELEYEAKHAGPRA